MSTIENESQGTGPRSPVIDLEAEDISPAADTGDAGTTAAADTPAKTQAPLWTPLRLATAAAIVAALAGALFYREIGTRLWPRDEVSQKLETLEASNSTLNQQLNAMGAAVDALKGETGKIAGDLASQSQTLDAKAAGMEKRIADTESALASLRETVAGLNAGSGETGSIAPAALAELKSRFDALEKAVADLKGGGTPVSDGGNMAPLSQALSDLKAKFAAGAPYKEEIDRIAVHVPAAPGFAELTPHAATGIANAQTLAAALEALKADLPKPETADAALTESGVGGTIWAWFGNVVKVRDLSAQDWSDLAGRAAEDAKAGDLKSAIARLDEPGADLPPQLAEWRDTAKARLAAEGALAEFSTAVMAVIAGKS